MSRIFNFSAGPAALPLAVLEQVQSEMLEWNGTGASVMEVSHRGAPFMQAAAQAEQDLRDLMHIPDNYKVLFLQGGATSQFSAIPLNLKHLGGSADYAHTGHWSKKAIADAKRFIDVNVVCDTSEEGYKHVPAESSWALSDDSAYLHITPNETIAGVEFDWLPDVNVPICADLSSTILSRPIDVAKYGIIYAGAQKNIGPAGLTIVIVRDDLIGHFPDDAPRLMDYQVMAESDSMNNTPPTFAWYLAGKVFAWLKSNGGVEAVAEVNRAKAEKLYSYIDGSDGFYTNPVAVDSRSWMNVPFILANSDLDAEFLAGSHDAGLHALKGHRSVGGMRASIYNAMPMAGIDSLLDFMDQFKAKHR
ncbi:3-phosphoserine/phosphohydroxythreonine transaminase [Arenicella xantha]|uniref:Phosphoserine aminotransferase n=1 Tax=Arenicella xantha TaxID=644221 RepID=A0A395JL96_9GAMM|nr:3-phosphoserine/phosphohydroxythreonine transaminase [Arenicella xantha]RBP51481.1 phosphoserine aminotransferase [Arenicella xantha]